MTANSAQNLTEESPPSPKDARSKGIPLESILAYRAKGLSTRDIGKMLGCDHSNIVKRLNNEGITTLTDYKNHRADIIALKGKKLLNSITDADIKKVNAFQRVTMYGILYDKERLERGQSTTNLDIIADLVAVKESMEGHKTDAKSDALPTHKAASQAQDAQDTAVPSYQVPDNLPACVTT